MAVDRLYRTCDVCGTTKYFTKFQTVGGNKNRRPVEKRRKPYCKECKSKRIHNTVEREVKIEEPNNAFTINDLSDEKYGHIFYEGKTGKWRFQIDIEKAKQLVLSGKARIRNPHKIIKLEYTNKEIRKFILERDNYKCYKCGEKADIAVKINNNGLRLPENMHSVCFECHNIKPYDPYKKWNKNPVNFAIPIYYNNKIVAAIDNPPYQIVNALNDVETKIYCDASHDLKYDLYGVAVVLVGGKHNGIRVYASTFKYKKAQIHYAELQAVQFALSIANDLGIDNAKCSIYTDVDFYGYVKPQKHMRQAVENILARKGDIKVHYIDNEQQKNPYYRMAHRYSRKALFDYINSRE